MVRPSWMTPLYETVSISLGGFVTLTNVGATFDAVNAAKGLGTTRVDLTNVQQIIFTVKVNKIGTGTQSWQLWNETDGAELGVITDAAGAGDKTLTTTIDMVPLGLSGIKQLRVRAKSTIAADDPLYYGSCITLS